jgi:hypothetical protein
MEAGMLCSMLISHIAIAIILIIKETKSKILYAWIPAQFIGISLGLLKLL